jgi:hypothetical protein
VLIITGFVEYNSPYAKYLDIGVGHQRARLVRRIYCQTGSIISALLANAGKGIRYQPQQLVSKPSVARVGRRSRVKYNPDW